MLHFLLEIGVRPWIHSVLCCQECQLEVDGTVNCQRLDRKAVPREHESLETATDLIQGLSLKVVVNARARNRFVPGGGATVGIVAVIRIRRARYRFALASSTLACPGRLLSFVNWTLLLLFTLSRLCNFTVAVCLNRMLVCLFTTAAAAFFTKYA